MQNSQDNQGGAVVTINLVRVAQAIWKRAWLIVIAALIFTGAGFILSAAFITPVYRSEFTAYLNNRSTAENSSSMNSADLDASMSLVPLYQEIMVSRSVLNDAAKLSGLDYSYNELKKMVDTDTVSNTAIIRVYVEAQDAHEAAVLADAIIQLASKHVSRVVEGSSMQVVDPPVEAKEPFRPNNLQNAVLAGLIGVVLSILGVCILEVADDKVQSVRELEDRYNVTVIGIIPDVYQAGKNGYNYSYGKSGGKRR